jgi:hypothetical protein
MLGEVVGGKGATGSLIACATGTLVLCSPQALGGGDTGIEVDVESEREAGPQCHSGCMKTFGAGLVFLAELGMYAGYSVLGWSLAQGVLGVVLAVALPVTVAVVWGLFLAPKAMRPMPAAPTVVLRLALMLGGALGAWAAGFWWLGVAVAVLAVVGTLLVGDTKGVASGGRE